MKDKHISLYTGEQIDTYVSHDHPKADYIVDTGFDGVWFWRKWHSGIAECWASITYKKVTIEKKWGDGYYTRLDGMPDYPVAFIYHPAMNATIQDTFGFGLEVFNYNDYTRRNPGTPYVYCPTMPHYNGEEIPLDITVNYHAIGEWALRIMTYNIGMFNWGASGGLNTSAHPDKIDNMKEFFKIYAPDICCFQEYRDKVDSGNTLKADNTIFGNVPYKYGMSADKCAVRSFYDLYDRKSGRISNGRKAIVHGSEISIPPRDVPYNYAKFRVGGKTIGLLDVHFTAWPGATNAEHPEWKDPEILAPYTDTRKDEMRKAIDLVKDDNYAIICGDFNVYPGEKEAVFGIATAAGFKMANGGTSGWHTTWITTSEKYAPFDEWYCDNILVKGKFKIQHIIYPDVYNDLCSDHVPIIMDLIFD